MEASQYKDYVLFMLFIKYVSDKFGVSDDMAPPVTIPKGEVEQLVTLCNDTHQQFVAAAGRTIDTHLKYPRPRPG
jgi:type I restriction-modification system DNA methylase subunit